MQGKLKTMMKAREDLFKMMKGLSAFTKVRMTCMCVCARACL